MNWEDVRYFLATAQQGSYSGAAVHLKVSHTTVARRVQILEQQLGVKLIERYGNKVRATEAGERLRRQAEQAQQHMLAAERGIAGLDECPAGNLRVTAPYLLCATLLPTWAAAFQQQVPDVQLDITAAVGRLNLNQREADVALRFTDHPPELLHGRLLARITWSIAILQSQAEAWWQVEPKPLCGEDDERATPYWWPTELGTFELRQRFNDPFLHLGAAKSGIAAALVPDFWLRGQDDLVRLAAAPQASRDLWLLAHRDMRHNARVQAFSRFMVAACRDSFTDPGRD